MVGQLRRGVQKQAATQRRQVHQAKGPRDVVLGGALPYLGKARSCLRARSESLRAETINAVIVRRRGGMRTTIDIRRFGYRKFVDFLFDHSSGAPEPWYWTTERAVSGGGAARLRSPAAPRYR